MFDGIQQVILQRQVCITAETLRPVFDRVTFLPKNIRMHFESFCWSFHTRSDKKWTVVTPDFHVGPERGDVLREGH